jgi:uncharacterized repeat protein (TIGR01451 family)
MFNIKLRTALACGSALAACTAVPAFAQSQTAAGTPVNNQATVSYDVGGSTSSVSSNVATFVVDKKVNLAVAEVGGAVTQTALGATNQVTTFTVTNLTNATQDFRLDPDQQLISIPLLGTDNFNVTNVRVFVDANGDGSYDAGDTQTFIDELLPDATVTVFIVSDVPSVPGQDTAIVSLNVVAAASGSSGSLGADLVASSTLLPDSAGTMETVFADGSGPLDLARNGMARAFDAYKISTAAVTLAKTSRVVSDPVNLLINPHAIPGATIEYCLAVNNAGPGTATNLVLADNVPANTTFVSGSIAVGTAGGTCVLAGTSEDDNATGADETDLYGGSFDGTTVRGTLPSVGVLGIYALSFRVTVN